MIDPVEYDLNRYLSEQERAEAIWERIEDALDFYYQEISQLAAEAKAVADGIQEEMSGGMYDFDSDVRERLIECL
jgi:hypothetical protein